eukprot:GFUD01136718.1.p1 GENE.GFUD01136718.1~~GFUD01136718.1.p1  ORF type:complete len:215 (-),score=29.02 GFUD01136718.1:183-827(-)
MVPTLRSMCLQKVLLVSPRINEALPTELLDDLIRMKVFNGKFSFDTEDVSGSKVQQTALSIQYDGVSWTFKSCCQSFPFFCCYNCDDFPRQEEHQFTVTEGEQFQLTSTFGDIMNWEVLLKKKKLAPVSMTMSVDFNEKKTYGDITFCGSEGSISFKSTLHVDLTLPGREPGWFLTRWRSTPATTCRECSHCTSVQFQLRILAGSTTVPSASLP